jgi:sulfite reductase (NADPH) flavoprotein alpha-component
MEEERVTAVPFLPKNAPFTAEDINVLNQLVQRSTPLQRSWLSGFLAGLDAAQGQLEGQTAGLVAPVPAQRPRQPLTILYGSESGNTESLALKAKKLAAKQNFDARVVDMADADLATIAKSKNLIVYISTWGEGDPPQRAADFYKALMAEGAPRFEGVRFAVLALGDTAYVNFCQTGREIDKRLEALGGTRAADRVDLDLDFQKAAATWIDKALVTIAPAEAASSATVVHVDFKAPLAADDDDEPRFTAENPAEAEISDLINLNGTGSTRETWHAEFTVDDAGFVYKPGDAIGLYPENDPDLAEDLLKAVGLAGNTDLKKKLVESFDITTLSRPLVDGYAKLTGSKGIAKLLEDGELARFSADRQLIDLFESFPEKLGADQFVKLLRPLPGRLYSVASSQKAHPGEAHLLVGAVRWNSHGRTRKGVTSTYLADRCKTGGKARIYVKPNRHFGLPADGDRPIIMIGAGTGVAPYRGFIEERAETGDKGKSWLFFGERNFSYDFLYQLEWQDHLASGTLSRIDVAFSRDQPEKIYVQTRLWERRQELLKWVDDGAHIYVCGDEKGMAKDVDATLARILAETAKGDEEAGRAKLKELTKAGRYQRDVY